LVDVDFDLGSILCVDMGTVTNISEIRSFGICWGKGRVPSLVEVIGSVERKILAITPLERVLLITCSCSQ
jgi:hypothetical protein